MKAPASNRLFRNSCICRQNPSARNTGNSLYFLARWRLSFGIERLVDIHPDYARYAHRHGDERQVGRDRAEQGPLVAPPGKPPEAGHQQEIGRNRQRVADVHRAYKIALLPLELEAADRTALIHREPPAKQWAAIDSALPATRAALTQNRDGDARLSVVGDWQGRVPPHRNMDRSSLRRPCRSGALTRFRDLR